MDDYKLLGKDEVKRILGTSSDQTAYKVIRQLNRELEAQGVFDRVFFCEITE